MYQHTYLSINHVRRRHLAYHQHPPCSHIGDFSGLCALEHDGRQGPGGAGEARWPAQQMCDALGWNHVCSGQRTRRHWSEAGRSQLASESEGFGVQNKSMFKHVGNHLQSVNYWRSHMVSMIHIYIWWLIMGKWLTWFYMGNIHHISLTRCVPMVPSQRWHTGTLSRPMWMFTATSPKSWGTMWTRRIAEAPNLARPGLGASPISRAAAIATSCGKLLCHPCGNMSICLLNILSNVVPIEIIWKIK